MRLAEFRCGDALYPRYMGTASKPRAHTQASRRSYTQDWRDHWETHTSITQTRLFALYYVRCEKHYAEICITQCRLSANVVMIRVNSLLYLHHFGVTLCHAAVDSGCHWHDPLALQRGHDHSAIHIECFVSSQQACMRRTPVRPNATRTVQHTRPVHSLTADLAITHTYLPHLPRLPHNEEDPRAK